MALRPEIVDYLRQNLKAHPADALKAQLAQEGVTEKEFQEALTEAKKPRRMGNPLGMALLGGGAAALLAGGFVMLSQKPAAPPTDKALAALASAAGETAFVGHYGYVVRLPKDYVAAQSFKDAKKTQEVVHFSKSGTDPTSLLDEGLYGQLGIVRLEVSPSELAGYTNGLEVLTKNVSSRATQRGEKFVVKNFSVSSLHGVQFTYEIPFARVEAFILGGKVLYSWHGGQEDEVFRDILNSLRETGPES